MLGKNGKYIGYIVSLMNTISGIINLQWGFRVIYIKNPSVNILTSLKYSNIVRKK